jgi:hypothetical protein
VATQNTPPPPAWVKDKILLDLIKIDDACQSDGDCAVSLFSSEPQDQIALPGLISVQLKKRKTTLNPDSRIIFLPTLGKQTLEK